MDVMVKARSGTEYASQAERWLASLREEIHRRLAADYMVDPQPGNLPPPPGCINII